MTRFRQFLFLSLLALPPLVTVPGAVNSAHAAEGRKLTYAEAEQLALSDQSDAAGGSPAAARRAG